LPKIKTQVDPGKEPPFFITEKEVRDLFAPMFEIRVLELSRLAPERRQGFEWAAQFLKKA